MWEILLTEIWIMVDDLANLMRTKEDSLSDWDPEEEAAATGIIDLVIEESNNPFLVWALNDNEDQDDPSLHEIWSEDTRWGDEAQSQSQSITSPSSTSSSSESVSVSSSLTVPLPILSFFQLLRSNI